ncbi:low-specificity L-threonine aldolase [Alicyclobacillus cycloheptanicus]|jgi:threonine aldolase|uniref:Threonine aldolase n=1 Tax=Alicyclobacillus cycloheptanicus TaxID=1457 RepID=A0ABT9XJN6_9BACL|nr:low-specificity L-threonine aldolase [Alicyclobacillus cycloheptanicus]MDQ0190523.1 threonine aldolase [Alicyclobacillus cycloheptanicus]WDM00718.1 low-specificity L-threonine aldolase [Alicyclobacillus cycloheptanicus]
MSRIDLRSDTVTKPTDAMRQAMATAEVGDDVYGEDPTVRRLEELAADLLGKEAALLVTSGTQGNQVAIATHAGRGEEVIAEAESHIFYYEAAAASAIAGVQIRQLAGRRGALDPDDVRAAIREPNVHHPRTALISLENTHNRAGGTVIPLDNLRRIRAVADAYGVPVHMDGARLFNAAVACGVSARTIADTVDTVQICLSKGLCAPVGSVLAGPKAFIERARQWRKRMGGGMRQAGVLAAPGILALTEMVDRLADDHVNARRLAECLAEMPGVKVDLETVQTNIVIADIGATGLTVPAFLDALAREGVLATSFGGSLVRFVTHHDVSRQDIETAADRIAAVVQAGARA